MPITLDHKITTASERARVEALGIQLGEKATRIPGGLAVSRALGDQFLKSENSGLIAVPFVSEAFCLGPDDAFLVVASDALWDECSGQEACDILMQSAPTEDAGSLAKTLLARAQRSTDNATVIVVKFE